MYTACLTSTFNGSSEIHAACSELGDVIEIRDWNNVCFLPGTVTGVLACTSPWDIFDCVARCKEMGVLVLQDSNAWEADQKITFVSPMDQQRFVIDQQSYTYDLTNSLYQQQQPVWATSSLSGILEPF